MEGESLEAQTEVIRRAWAARPNQYTESLAEKGIELIEPFFQESVSAYKTPFIARPAGMLLNASLQPGDHILFAIHTRAFRNAADWSATNDLWRKKGVQYHFCNVPFLGHLDSSSAAGWLLLGTMMAGAQMESEQRSLTTRTMAQHCRMYSNKPWNKSHYLFNVAVLPNGEKVLEPLFDRFVDVYQMFCMIRNGFDPKIAWQATRLNARCREGHPHVHVNSISAMGRDFTKMFVHMQEIFGNPHWAHIVEKLPLAYAARWPKGDPLPRGKGMKGAYHMLDERVQAKVDSRLLPAPPALIFQNKPDGSPGIARKTLTQRQAKAPSAAAVDRARILLENARAREAAKMANDRRGK
jgi:hypothetical protein